MTVLKSFETLVDLLYTVFKIFFTIHFFSQQGIGKYGVSESYILFKGIGTNKVLAFFTWTWCHLLIKNAAYLLQWKTLQALEIWRGNSVYSIYRWEQKSGLKKKSRREMTKARDEILHSSWINSVEEILAKCDSWEFVVLLHKSTSLGCYRFFISIKSLLNELLLGLPTLFSNLLFDARS